MLIELHILQNFAPSNLNRDDTNNPKDCEFGGVRRARISSQCIKRATRMAPVFAKTTGTENGQRSKLLISILEEELARSGKTAEVTHEMLGDLVSAYFSKLDGKDKSKTKTAVLLYFSKGERAAMAKTVLDNWDALKASDRSKTVETLAREWVKLNKGTTSAPDIALFGRMLAEHPDLNIDAACQVAHAISTHRVSMEMDYYTAVDDLTPDDNAGAGMIGFTGFNSACFYRYACLDWNQLLSNLNGDTALARKTVEAFLKASSDAIPTGKQNGFAANNPPGFYLAVAREDGSAWSLANAFEQPVKPAREGGYMRPSIQALDAYWGMLEKVYDADGVKKKVTLSLDDDAELVNLKDAPAANRGAWITAVLDALPGK